MTNLDKKIDDNFISVIVIVILLILTGFALISQLVSAEEFHPNQTEICENFSINETDCDIWWNQVVNQTNITIEEIIVIENITEITEIWCYNATDIYNETYKKSEIDEKLGSYVTTSSLGSYASSQSLTDLAARVATLEDKKSGTSIWIWILFITYGLGIGILFWMLRGGG